MVMKDSLLHYKGEGQHEVLDEVELDVKKKQQMERMSTL